MERVIIIPGTKAANADIDLPAMYPKARALARVAVISLVEGAPNTLSESVKAIILTGTPAAGQVILYDEDTIRIGDATTTSQLIIVDYIKKGELSGF